MQSYRIEKRVKSKKYKHLEVSRIFLKKIRFYAFTVETKYFINNFFKRKESFQKNKKNSSSILRA